MKFIFCHYRAARFALPQRAFPPAFNNFVAVNVPHEFKCVPAKQSFQKQHLQSPSPNSSLNPVRFTHWTHKSCAFARRLAQALGACTGSRVSSPQHLPTVPIRPHVVQRQRSVSFDAAHGWSLLTQRRIPSARTYQGRGLPVTRSIEVPKPPVIAISISRA